MSVVFKIYKIKSPNTDKIYIGCTKSKLKRRLCEHNSRYRQFLNNKSHYYTSFDVIKCGDAEIELIEEVKVDKDANVVEGDIIKKTDNCVNRVIAGRTKQQYYQDNRLKILNYKKTKVSCNLCGKKISRSHIARHIKLIHN